MSRRTPRSTRTDTLLPGTTLFRSRQAERCLQHEVVGDPGDEPDAGAALRSCGHPRGDGHEQHQVALDPEDLELAGHAELEGEGEDQEERHAHGPDHGTDLRHDGGSQSITGTKARRSVSAAGPTMRSTVRPEVDSLVDRTDRKSTRLNSSR